MAEYDIQRRFERREVAMTATLTLDDGQVVTGTTGTLGMGGFSVALNFPLSIGTGMTAQLRAGTGPEAVVVTAPALVVWAQEDWVGVAFLDMDEANETRLKGLVPESPPVPAGD
jgi:hypothetical protein